MINHFKFFSLFFYLLLNPLFSFFSGILNCIKKKKKLKKNRSKVCHLHTRWINFLKIYFIKKLSLVEIKIKTFTYFCITVHVVGIGFYCSGKVKGFCIRIRDHYWFDPCDLILTLPLRFSVTYTLSNIAIWRAIMRIFEFKIHSKLDIVIKTPV